jgi:hypothetical protein
MSSGAHESSADAVLGLLATLITSARARFPTTKPRYIDAPRTPNDLENDPEQSKPRLLQMIDCYCLLE